MCYWPPVDLWTPHPRKMICKSYSRLLMLRTGALNSSRICLGVIPIIIVLRRINSRSEGATPSRINKKSQNLVISHLDLIGRRGVLIGWMEIRWTGSVGFEKSVLPGRRWVFFGRGDLNAEGQENRGPGGEGGMLITGRTCGTEGEDGKHMSNFTLIYLWLAKPQPD